MACKGNMLEVINPRAAKVMHWCCMVGGTGRVSQVVVASYDNKFTSGVSLVDLPARQRWRWCSPHATGLYLLWFLGRHPGAPVGLVFVEVPLGRSPQLENVEYHCRALPR